MDKPPMRAERNASGDVIYYLILCPKCKEYNRLHSVTIDTLSGERPFWCNSNICRLTTQLKIVNGWAIEVNRPMKPDLGQDKPKKVHDISTEAFTKQRIFKN